MRNFERLKSLENEYEMTDLIMYVISTRYSEIIQKDGTLNGLPVLRWLQENHEKTNTK